MAAFTSFLEILAPKNLFFWPISGLQIQNPGLDTINLAYGQRYCPLSQCCALAWQKERVSVTFIMLGTCQQKQSAK